MCDSLRVAHFFNLEGISMVDYKSLYFKLFAAMADAVDVLEERKDIEKAKEILINAQLETEEIYIESEGD